MFSLLVSLDMWGNRGIYITWQDEQIHWFNYEFLNRISNDN